jgi:hypothetical protein
MPLGCANYKTLEKNSYSFEAPLGYLRSRDGSAEQSFRNFTAALRGAKPKPTPLNCSSQSGSKNVRAVVAPQMLPGRAEPQVRRFKQWTAIWPKTSADR